MSAIPEVMTPSPPNAVRRTPAPGAVLTLLKPVTWFPPMWAFLCGVVSSGAPFTGNGWILAGGIFLCGPLTCASSQAVNDWFDRHVDAINEPGRPIPSGRIPGRWGLGIAIVWSLLALAWSSLFGVLGLTATAVALALSWGYSMPPFRFKQNGWVGNGAVGLAYEGLAWLTGIVVVSGHMPTSAQWWCIGLYSLAGHGILTLNDFKAIDGDRQMGVNSLPVLHGAPAAGRIATGIMLVSQLAMLALLLLWGRPGHAAVLALLIGVQVLMFRTFVRAPIEKALWLSAAGVPLEVLGMLVSALAVRSSPLLHG